MFLEFSLRSGMDVYMRGVQTLENCDVFQMGGIRPFADALGSSHVISYIYFMDDCYIMEINLSI